MLDDNDRARTAYVKHFYGADPADPRLYHLVIDTTRLPASAAVDLIAAAARAL
jgi:cytidylate kinase